MYLFLPIIVYLVLAFLYLFHNRMPKIVNDNLKTISGVAYLTMGLYYILKIKLK